MKFGIDRYIGNWKSEDGYRLEIRKVNEVNASVSLLKTRKQNQSLQRTGGERASFSKFRESYSSPRSLIRSPLDKAY